MQRKVRQTQMKRTETTRKDAGLEDRDMKQNLRTYRRKDDGPTQVTNTWTPADPDLRFGLHGSGA